MKSRTLNRRAFVRAGALFVPAVLIARKSLGQFGSFNDQAFLAQASKSSSNGLLNGLVSYWKFDTGASPSPDSVGSNDLTVVGGVSLGGLPGALGFAAGLGVGSSALRPSSQTDFSFGVGVSFTFSTWIYATSWSTATGTFICFVSKLVTSISNREYLVVLENDVGTNYIAWGATDTNGVQGSVNFGLPSDNAWHHLVFGFDASSSKVFGQLDNGTRLTASTTSNGIRILGGTVFSFGEYVLNDENAIPGMRLDEVALYHRALSTTDVANLYNAGGALPLSSFTT